MKYSVDGTFIEGAMKAMILAGQGCPISVTGDKILVDDGIEYIQGIYFYNTSKNEKNACVLYLDGYEIVSRSIGITKLEQYVEQQNMHSMEELRTDSNISCVTEDFINDKIIPIWKVRGQLTPKLGNSLMLINFNKALEAHDADIIDSTGDIISNDSMGITTAIDLLAIEDNKDYPVIQNENTSMGVPKIKSK